MAVVFPIPFQCALVAGGYGNLGTALAKYFLSKGKKVILSGPRYEDVRANVVAIGATSGYYLDMRETSRIPVVIARILTDHPYLDCVVMVPCPQKALRLHNVQSKICEIDLTEIDGEVDKNIRGPLHLVAALLPHIYEKVNAGTIIQLPAMPASTLSLNAKAVSHGYKDFTHGFLTNLRSQLIGVGSKVKFIEVPPPSITTKAQTDFREGSREGDNEILTVEEWMEYLSTFLENEGE